MRARALTTICGAAAVALVAAPGALASAVTVSNGTRVNVSAAGNERNDFGIRYDAGTDAYVVTDSAGITPGGVCAPVDPETATCPAPGIGSITVNAGGGSDHVVLDAATIPATVEATLAGGTGNDRLVGSAAADALDGDSGNDGLDGGPGADDLRGGSGRDTVSYDGRTESVVVTLGSGEDDDGGPPDVTGPRRDTARGDIEQVIGGGGPDTLFGDASDDTLLGAGGDDHLFGLGGADHLDGGLNFDRISGGRGSDRLLGGPSGDVLRGGPQSDRLSGGFGNDVLIGKKGPDAMNGKAGFDRIDARDGGRDLKINCGAGGTRFEGAKRDRKLDPRPRSC